LATAPILEPTGPRAVASRARVSNKLDSVLLYGLSGLLLSGPLAFGAVEYWSIFIFEIGVSALLAAWAIRQVKASDFQFTPNALFLPMLGFAALIVIQLATGRSAYSAETTSQGLLYCAYGAVSFLAAQCIRPMPSGPGREPKEAASHALFRRLTAFFAAARFGMEVARLLRSASMIFTTFGLGASGSSLGSASASRS